MSLLEDLSDLARRRKDALARHPLYRQLDDLESLRHFMERHVACVLDFMSLLKSLQRDLTCVEAPWTPPADAEAARLINEIVLAEESDEVAPGRHLSHFEWYLRAMEELGADTDPIRRLVRELRAGRAPREALLSSGLPAESVHFSSRTFATLERPLHVRLAVFLHGREDVIPRMFLPLAERLADRGLECPLLLAYLRRHVEVDGDEHGPAAACLLERLVGEDAERLREGFQAALEALDARAELWDAVAERFAAAARLHHGPGRRATTE